MEEKGEKGEKKRGIWHREERGKGGEVGGDKSPLAVNHLSA